MIEFEYIPTPDDFKKAWLVNYNNSGIWAVLLMFVIFNICTIFGNGNDTIKWLMPSISIAVILFFVLFTTLYHGSLLRKNKEAGVFQNKIRGTAEEQGILIVGKDVEVKIGWNQFQRAVETDIAFLLMHNNNFFQLVPKRAFASFEEQQAFKSLVSGKIRQYKYIPPRKKLPSNAKIVWWIFTGIVVILIIQALLEK